MRKILPVIFLLMISWGYAQPLQEQAYRSIELANHHLKTSSQTFNSQFILLLLSYLEKNYDYTCPLPLDSLLSISPTFEDEKHTISYYHRIGKKMQASSLSKIDNLQALERLMLWAMYADKKKLDSTFQFLLVSYTDTAQNIRNVAHAALAIAWLKELNQWEKVGNHTHILAQTITLLNKHIRNDLHTVSDTEMECMIGILLIDNTYQIPDKWILSLINTQNIEGSWAMNEANVSNTAHQHPTTLALWLLHIYICPQNNRNMLLP